MIDTLFYILFALLVFSLLISIVIMTIVFIAVLITWFKDMKDGHYD